MPMCFVCRDEYVLYDMNIAQMLSTCTVMGSLKKTPIDTRIAWENGISKNTSVVAEYPDAVTDSVIVF